MDQDHSAEDDVERPEVARVSVVDVALDPLYTRSKQLLCDAEALSSRLLREVLRPPSGRPVQRALVVEVKRQNLGRATAFHLKRPEPVPGSDVEYAHSVQSVGDAIPVNPRTEIEHSARGHARSELKHVIPLTLLRLIEELHRAAIIADTSGDSPSVLNNLESPGRCGSLRSEISIRRIISA